MKKVLIKERWYKNCGSFNYHEEIIKEDGKTPWVNDVEKTIIQDIKTIFNFSGEDDKVLKFIKENLEKREIKENIMENSLMIADNSIHDIEEMPDDYVYASWTKENLDVSKYNNPNFCIRQARFIKKGLEDGLNVSVYANEKFNWMQMREIYLGLKNNIDVSEYTDSKYTYREMYNMRKKIQKKQING